MVKKTEIVFFGTPDFSCVVLEKLITLENTVVKFVVTQPDRTAGRKLELQKSPVKLVAEKYQLPILQPSSLRKEQEQFIKEIGSFDVGIVVAYGQIIPENILNAANFGFINIHASLLPRWRGAAPIQRALLAGDLETGVGLMKMTPRLDDGAVYCEDKIFISNLNYGEVHDRLSVMGASLLYNNIFKIINEEITPTEQSEIGITYANKITNEESQINWNDSADHILKQIMAFSPIPGAYTQIDDQRLKVFSAIITSNKSEEAGKFTINSSGNLEVETKTFNLEIIELQLAGRKRQTCASLLNGYKPKGNFLK